MQTDKCGSIRLKDYWVFHKEDCPSNYTYAWGVSSSDNTTPFCYALMDIQWSDVTQRYQEKGYLANCGDVESTGYDQKIIDLLSRANTSWILQEKLESDISELKIQAGQMNDEIESQGKKMSAYNEAIKAASIKIYDLQDKMEDYFEGMNCTMIQDLTADLYLSFCGEYLQNLFDSSLYIGSLGICQMFLSISAILILFRFRTDLEIEQEKILRTIGRSKERNIQQASDTFDSGDITNRTNDSSVVSEVLKNTKKYK